MNRIVFITNCIFYKRIMKPNANLNKMRNYLNIYDIHY